MTVVLIAGCASVTPVESPAASAPTWPSDTSYGRLFSQVQPDGTVSKDVALLAFSTAIAPLPGVPVAPGGPPQDFERADGTFAIDWLMPYMDQLTPEQQAAVNAALAPSSADRMVEPARPIAEVGTEPLGPVDAADDPGTDFPTLIASDKSTIASKLHRDLPGNIHFGFGVLAPNGKGAENALAFAYPSRAPGTPSWEPSGDCEVRATPALAGQSPAGIAATMAHEVFHCFQFAVLPGGSAFGDLGWIIEGQAEWAGEDVGGPSPIGDGWWARYLVSPSESLFGSDYTAVGFYEQLAETGTSPWSVFDAMLSTPYDSDAAFTASGATDDGFLDTWASGVSRNAALPDSWKVRGRWTTPAKAPTQDQAIEDDSDVPLAAAKGTTADFKVNTVADITILDFDGHVRMYNAGADTPDIQAEYLCTSQSPDGCNCPKGFTYDGPTLTPGNPEIYLGLTGGLDGVTGNVRGRPLSDFCKPDPTPNGAHPRGGPNPCANGCAGSIGDPHLETLDQQPYEFQAAGEYTLLRSADGSMEIQGRQVPYPDIPNVSITTALAWKVAGHRVGMYANQGSDTYSLWLDGTQVDPLTLGTQDLGGGAALTALPDGLEVAYGDGTLTTVLFHGNGFAQALDIQIAPSDTFRAQGTGLLGPIAAGSELPALPDGTALPLSQVRATQFTQRYQQLAQAWHVTDQTSLFDYKPGETTATFDKPGFPTADVAFTAAELEQQQAPADVQNANDACVGATGQPEDLEHCIFDILATKDPNYAQFYALLAQFLANGPTVLGGPILEVTSPPQATPSTTLPAGFVQVTTDVSLIKGATIGQDGILYASILRPDDSTALVSVDTTSGSTGPSVATTGSGGLFLLHGSLWLAQDDPTGFDKCSLERLDPVTLAEQATIPVGCDFAGVQAAPVADGVWWLDRSTADGDGKGGMIRHIDPATNAVDRSVEVPFVNGFLTSSPTTVVFGSSDADAGWYRLTQGASAFTPLALPGQTFGLHAQGEGVWFQPVQSLGAQGEADYFTGPATPDRTISIDGILIGADEQALYVDSSSSDPDSLMRYSFDGSAPTAILTGATLTTSNGDHDLGFFDNDPLVLANQKIAKLWLVLDWPAAGTTTVIARAVSVP